MRHTLSMRGHPRVRLMLVILALARNPVVTASPPAQMSACEELDAQGRTAMQWFISGAFPVPSPWIECREDNGVNAATLLDNYVQTGHTDEHFGGGPGDPCTGASDEFNLMHGTGCRTRYTVTTPECSDMRTNIDESQFVELF